MSDKLENKFEHPYHQVPNDLYEIGLTTHEIAVYGYLTRCTNAGSTAFPSYNTIASKCGMSRSKAIKTIDSLIEKKIVEKKPRANNHGEQISNIYSVNHSNLVGISQRLGGVSQRLGSLQKTHDKELEYKEIEYKEINVSWQIRVYVSFFYEYFGYKHRQFKHKEYSNIEEFEDEEELKQSIEEYFDKYGVQDKQKNREVCSIDVFNASLIRYISGQGW